MIVVVDYGLGNLFSVKKALEALGADAIISDQARDIRAAERVVLPGIGAFGDGIRYLKERGLDGVLEEEIVGKRKPFLGICLGMQLLADVGFECGEHAGLGFIRGSVRKLNAEKDGLRVPHIGWNDVTPVRDTPLFYGLPPRADFYFVHSFHVVSASADDVAAKASYGGDIVAAIQHENIFATQFHPEKSQDHGLKILENFIHWNP